MLKRISLLRNLNAFNNPRIKTLRLALLTHSFGLHSTLNQKLNYVLNRKNGLAIHRSIQKSLLIEQNPGR
ncbi:hypothetical protein BpHYR1_013825 [Brachionus plicatilis]|uniref:Uncharacterized protein n=1 Tax=Brachionus plicatilis TaxID=10195 RepID=A0A3M7SWZ1_BRAPC|nr:hypothetical protein BpHYR1_013825 [Brachionus plicatilis]